MIDKKYLDEEIKKHTDSLENLQKQEIQVKNAIQQTVGVLHSLNTILDKVSENEDKSKAKK